MAIPRALKWLPDGGDLLNLKAPGKWDSHISGSESSAVAGARVVPLVDGHPIVAGVELGSAKEQVLTVVLKGSIATWHELRAELRAAFGTGETERLGHFILDDEDEEKWYRAVCGGIRQAYKGSLQVWEIPLTTSTLAFGAVHREQVKLVNPVHSMVKNASLESYAHTGPGSGADVTFADFASVGGATGAYTRLSSRSRYGGWTALLDPGVYTTLWGRRLRQPMAVTLNSDYSLSLWWCPRYDPNGVGTADIRVNGRQIELRRVETDVADGLTWERWAGNYTHSTSAATVNVDWGTLGCRALVDGLQMEPVGAPYARQSARFDGVTGAITAPYNAALNFAGNACTLRCKVRRDGVADTNDALVKMNLRALLRVGTTPTGAAGPQLQGIIWVNNAGAALAVSIAGGVLGDTELQDAELSYDGTTLRLFLNGALVASVAEARQLWTGGTGPLTIGAGVNIEHFRGWVDEVEYASVARHTAAFTPHTGPLLPDASTVALYHLDGGATDSGGNGLHGAANAGVTWPRDVGVRASLGVPRDFHRPDTQEWWVDIPVGGDTSVDPAWALTPKTTPAGRRQKYFTLRAENPMEDADWEGDPFPLTIKGAGPGFNTSGIAQGGLVAAGSLHEKGWDLIVETEDGERLWARPADTSQVDWKVWVAGLHLRRGKRTNLLVSMGTHAALRDPAEFLPPRNLRIARVRDERDDERDSRGRRAEVLRHNRDYWWVVATYNRVTGESLASAPVRHRWDDNGDEGAPYGWIAKLTWEEARYADEIWVYRADRDADGTQPEADDYELVRRVEAGREEWAERGHRPVDPAKHPRFSGPVVSPYDEDRPVFSLTGSTATMWRYERTLGFRDPVRRRRPGRWTVHNRGNARRTRHAHRTGISTNPQQGSMPGDAYYLRPPAPAVRVEGSVDLYEDPNEYGLMLWGETLDGDPVNLDNADGTKGLGDKVPPPSVYARARGANYRAGEPGYPAADTNLPAGEYVIAATGKDTAGNYTDGHIIPIELRFAGRVSLKIRAASAGGAGHALWFAKKGQRPRLVNPSVNAGIEQVVVILPAANAEPMPAVNDTAREYSSPTAVAFDTGTLTKPLREVMFHLEERKRVPDPEAAFSLSVVNVHMDPAKCLKVWAANQAAADANQPATPPQDGAHFEIRFTSEDTGDSFTFSSLAMTLNRRTVIDTRRKRVSADVRGRGMLQAVRLSAPRSRWLPLLPRRTNRVRLKVIQRDAPTGGSVPPAHFELSEWHRNLWSGG